MPIKRVWWSTVVISALLLLSSFPCFAQPYAFIPDFDNGTVHVIRVSDGATVFDSITVGGNPIGVAVSPNGRHVFVTNQDSGTVSIIDATQLGETENSTAVSSVLVGSGPTGIVVSEDGQWVFVANQDGDNISIVAIDESNPQYSQEIGTIKLDAGINSKPAGLAIHCVSENLYYLYVTNRGTNEIHEIEITVIDNEIAHEVTATIGVGDSPMGITVSPDGDFVYVANVGDGTNSGTVSTVSVSGISTYQNAYDTSNKTYPNDDGPDETIFHSPEPAGSIFKPYGITASPDNNYIYISNRIELIIGDVVTPKRGVVSVLEWSQGKLRDTNTEVKVGKRPHGIAVSPQRDKLFIANRGNGTVSSVDLDETSLEGVTASDISDLSLSSPIAFGQFIGNIAPQRPTGLTATVVSDTEIQLTWETSSEGTAATGFLINARTDSSEFYTEFMEITDGTLDTCIVTGLDEGTTYYFHIAAVNEDVRSSYADHALKSTLDGAVRSTFSEEDSAKTNPAAPSDLMATDTSSKEIILQWTDNSNGESHFVVERKKISEESTSDSTSDKEESEAVAEDFEVIASDLTADTTSYSDQDEDLEANASYLYRVKAVDASEQESGYSNEAEAEASDKCFIATAAFGSLLEPHVVTLRKFRDAYLRTNIPGRAFVRFYYATSPPIAKFIGSHAVVRTIVRWSLIPVVALSHCTLRWGLPMTLTLLFFLGMGTVLIKRNYLQRKNMRA